MQDCTCTFPHTINPCMSMVHILLHISCICDEIPYAKASLIYYYSLCFFKSLCMRWVTAHDLTTVMNYILLFHALAIHSLNILFAHCTQQSHAAHMIKALDQNGSALYEFHAVLYGMWDLAVPILQSCEWFQCAVCERDYRSPKTSVWKALQTCNC